MTNIEWLDAESHTPKRDIEDYSVPCLVCNGSSYYKAYYDWDKQSWFLSADGGPIYNVTHFCEMMKFNPPV